VSFSARTVTSLTLTVTGVSGSTQNVGLAEIQVYGSPAGTTNQPPTANAGADKTVNEGTAVSLPGSGSDPDGTITSYAWTQTAGPTVTLSGANTATASFTAPQVTASTVLTFRLTVTDNGGATGTDTVNVTVNDVPAANQPPTANAGPDQTVSERAQVTLSGSGADSDGTIASYSWTQTSGTSVALSGTSSANASFTAPSVTNTTVLTFRLTVTDNLGASANDTVNINVLDSGGNSTLENGVPVSGISGSSGTQRLFRFTVPSGASNLRFQISGGTGDADLYVRFGSWPTTSSYDCRPRLTGNNETCDMPNATAGSWRIMVRGFSAFSNVALVASYTTGTTNQPPTANAGADKTVNEGTAVSLPGSGSDPDGTITSYAWTQTAGPTVTLSGANTATASFTAPQVTASTVLTFRLTVTDNGGATGTDTVNVTVNDVPAANQPPTANAGPDQTVSQGVLVQLNGTGSFDPEGLSLTYQWTQTAGPAVVLSNAATATPSFTSPTGLTQNTTLTFRLTVTDAGGASASDTVNVTVQATQASSNIAPLATVTASSQNTGTGQLAVKAVDGVIDGYPGDYTREWATNGQGSGAWLRLAWTSAYVIDRVVLYDRPNTSDQITAATLSFSDGSSVTVGSLNNAGGATTVSFSARTVTSLTLTVTGVSGSTQNVGLAEIQVYGSP
jgi:hypothetical protein